MVRRPHGDNLTMLVLFGSLPKVVALRPLLSNRAHDAERNEFPTWGKLFWPDHVGRPVPMISSRTGVNFAIQLKCSTIQLMKPPASSVTSSLSNSRGDSIGH